MPDATPVLGCGRMELGGGRLPRLKPGVRPREKVQDIGRQPPRDPTQGDRGPAPTMLEATPDRRESTNGTKTGEAATVKPPKSGLADKKDWWHGSWWNESSWQMKSSVDTPPWRQKFRPSEPRERTMETPKRRQEGSYWGHPPKVRRTQSRTTSMGRPPRFPLPREWLQ